MEKQSDELLYRIGLTLLPGIGDVLGKKLVHLCGSAEAVFREPRRYLKKMPRIVGILSQAGSVRDILIRAEKELRFLERFSIMPLFFQDSSYPRRLKNCIDSPVMVYYKGTADLNAVRVVGMVGTRKATEYGKCVSRDIIGGLSGHKVLVVSGLAFGIDGFAHHAALDAGLETVGVLGHGLDTVYPWQHRSMAEKMLQQGGLITEFLSHTKPDRTNFPRRNRIIAGLCDAIIVVEAGSRGGALITADIANSYNRDVFAVPGRVSDPFSEGTNTLIRTNRAALIQHARDVEYLMGWNEERAPAISGQRKIFIELTDEEKKIVDLLSDSGPLGIDEICIRTGNAMSRISAALLNLEFEAVVRCAPGKIYSMV